MGTGKSYQHEMLYLLGKALFMVFFRGLGSFFVFAVKVLSEALMGSISLDMQGKTNLIRHSLMGGKGGFTFLLVQTFLVNLFQKLYQIKAVKEKT